MTSPVAVPASVKSEHEDLQVQLARAVREKGALGDAARELARVMKPHFAREEAFALPPLALLPKIARGIVHSDMAWVINITKRLKAEIPIMIIEHKDIAAVVNRFRTRAEEADRDDYVHFAHALIVHAQYEEEVLYPAAVLVGEYVALKLAQHTETV